MIVHIKGKILSKDPEKVVIDVNGIGYQCNISNYTYNQLPNKSKEVSLNTFLQIINLYFQIESRK